MECVARRQLAVLSAGLRLSSDQQMPKKVTTWRTFHFGRKTFGSRKTSEEAEAKNRQGRKVYDSANWQRLRLLQLASFPLCAFCGNEGEQIDHVVPITKGGAAFDQRNLQTLCASCHSSKTARDKRGDV